MVWISENSKLHHWVSKTDEFVYVSGDRKVVGELDKISRISGVLMEWLGESDANILRWDWFKMKELRKKKKSVEAIPTGMFTDEVANNNRTVSQYSQHCKIVCVERAFYSQKRFWLSRILNNRGGLDRRKNVWTERSNWYRILGWWQSHFVG